MKKSTMNRHTKTRNKPKATMMRTMNRVKTQTIDAVEAGKVTKRTQVIWIPKMHSLSSLPKNKKNRLKMKKSMGNTRSRSRNMSKINKN